jgi:hypothetical protein
MKTFINNNAETIFCLGSITLLVVVVVYNSITYGIHSPFGY